jgi:hypothetical protein
MHRRPGPASAFWIYWRLPNGRSGKLGPFFGPLAASESLTERDPRQPVAPSRGCPRPLDLTRRPFVVPLDPDSPK